jgi:1-deoxy-D-xylulose-5-phosphate reductoisomerase
MGLKTINIVRNDRPNVDGVLKLLTNLGGDVNVTDAYVNTPGFNNILRDLGGCKLAFNCVGGELVTQLAEATGARILPVDSEHAALHQLLAGLPVGTATGLTITASGGPFRTVDKETMRQASVEQALAHPTWKMGPKITIDSATMMNKALEVVEAHWLFDLPAEKIQVIIHPQSVAHSFVEFADHSVLAQLGSPDMKTPIQYALMYPDRPIGCSQPMDWTKLSRLDFEQPDTDKFPALRLAYEVIEAGGTAGAIFNAANEAAVAAFLDQRVRFGRIVELVAEALDAIAPVHVDSLATVLAADQQARQFVQERLRVEAGVA